MPAMQGTKTLGSVDDYIGVLQQQLAAAQQQGNQQAIAYFQNELVNAMSAAAPTTDMEMMQAYGGDGGPAPR